MFTVTLGCFPAVTVLVVSTGAASGSAWTNVYFIPVVCFLLFNIGDWVGRIMAEKIQARRFLDGRARE